MMKRWVLFRNLGMLLAAGVLSIGSLARDSSDAGCTESDGTWTCTGETVTVTGTPLDSFDCRRVPLNCVPVAPPSRPRPGSADGGGGVGTGYEGATREQEQVTLGALRAMDCGELRDLEKTYKVHVEFARQALAAHKETLRHAEARLRDPEFSVDAFGQLQDLANLSCGNYEMTRDRRLNGPKMCTERAGKPEICRPPPPSRAELAQAISCRDNSRELNARRGDLGVWNKRKADAEAGVLAMAGNLRHVQGTLGRIQTEAARKNCPA